MSETPLGEPIAPATYPPGWTVPEFTEETGPRRPGTVVAAAIITWVSSAIVVGGAISLLVFLTWIGEPFLDSFDVSSDWVVAITVVVTIWATIACVLARLAMTGRNWARLALVGSAGVTVLASALTALAALPLVSLFAAIVVIVLLFIGGANEWYRDQRSV